MTSETERPKDTAVTARRLDFIQPRETKRAVKARSSRTTQRIAQLRYILPIGALILLVALALWPMIDPNKIKAMVVKNIADLVVEDLHFTGLDSKNQPYSMTAKRATRPGGGLTNLYDLVNPQAEITLDTGAWISGRAQYGRYDQDKHQLWLGGDVQLFHDKGYQFTTDEAQVSIDEDAAWGEKPVLLQGGFGEIRGQGFRVLDSGKTMVIKGPGKAILNLHSGAPSDKPAEENKP
ncbi:MAG: LPS export ABC transporter periplasmic protein LptC [Pseudomonadota bacterium]|nr:LPS export ABC transporter periplasmic protein LptC [Pseudomonadota bacterium]